MRKLPRKLFVVKSEDLQKETNGARGENKENEKHHEKDETNRKNVLKRTPEESVPNRCHSAQQPRICAVRFNVHVT